MNDCELYSQILGTSSAWKVKDVAIDLPNMEIGVEVASSSTKHKCPECGMRCSVYD